MVRTTGNPDSREKSYLQKKLPSYYEEQQAKKRGRQKGYELKFFQDSEFKVQEQKQEQLVPIYNLREGTKILVPKYTAKRLYSRGYLGKTTRITDAEGVQYYEKTKRRPYTYGGGE